MRLPGLSSFAAWMIFIAENCSGISQECRIIFRWRRSDKPPLRSQFQKRNHLLLQFRRREFEHGVERRGIGHVKFAGNAAAERSQVRAAAEFLAEFMRDAADVSAFGAGDFKLAERRLVIRKAAPLLP